MVRMWITVIEGLSPWDQQDLCPFMKTDRSEESNQEERDMYLVKAASAGLCEHFDSVQIFATKRVNESTISAVWGDGNYWARIGVVKDWVLKEDQRSRIEASKDSD